MGIQGQRVPSPLQNIFNIIHHIIREYKQGQREPCPPSFCLLWPKRILQILPHRKAIPVPYIWFSLCNITSYFLQQRKLQNNILLENEEASEVWRILFELWTIFPLHLISSMACLQIIMLRSKSTKKLTSTSFENWEATSGEALLSSHSLLTISTFSQPQLLVSARTNKELLLPWMSKRSLLPMLMPCDALIEIDISTCSGSFSSSAALLFIYLFVYWTLWRSQCFSILFYSYLIFES